MAAGRTAAFASSLRSGHSVSMPIDARADRAGLVRIFLRDEPADVPQGAALLRCLERIAGRAIVEGNYCWSGECGHCEVVYAQPGRRAQSAMACTLGAVAGMRIISMSRHLVVDLGK
jgi:hypothetical protein